jgi:hypothetical protein
MTTSNLANHVQGASLAVMAVLVFASPVRASNAARGLVAINSDFAGGNVKATANTKGEVYVEPDLRGDRPWFYWCFEAAATRPGRVNCVVRSSDGT